MSIEELRGRLNAALRYIEAEIAKKQKYLNLEALSANELAIALAKDHNMWMRLLHLQLQTEVTEIEDEDGPLMEATNDLSVLGEPKIIPGTVTRIRLPEES